MKPFTGDTDVVHKNALPPQVRGYFSATGVRPREQVWLRVETRWVGDGVPLKITIYREDEQGGREVVKELKGTIAGDLWEHQWRVELPKERLDEIHDDIRLTFDAELKGLDPVRSQTLLVHRTAHSS